MHVTTIGTTPSLEPRRQAVLHRRAARLAWATVTYNTVEGLVAVAAGMAVGSVALVSFGLDSAIEVASAVAVSWQYAGGGARAREHESASSERCAS